MSAALQPSLFAAVGQSFDVPVKFDLPDESAVRPAPVQGFRTYPARIRAEQSIVVPEIVQGKVLLSGQTLDAGNSATYADALRTATGRGLILPIAASTGRTTLGAGLVTNLISRFSTVYGRAADSVESFELATPDGQRRLVRRPDETTGEENDALFRAVPGGFGYLGAVGRIRTRLLPLSLNAGWTTPNVETATNATTTFEGLVDALVFDHLLATDAFVPALKRPTADALATWALTSQDGRGILFRAQYVAGDRPLDPCALHLPQGIRGRTRGLASFSPTLGRLGWRLFWERTARRHGSFIDSLAGFTFHMDDAWRASELLQRTGGTPWEMRQSFLLPIRRTEGDPGRRTKQFLTLARVALDEAGLRANPFQLVSVAADNYLLSASRNCEGILVSVSSQGLSESRATRFASVLRRLSRHCADLGGRVQLDKGMAVEQHVLEQMYGDALAKFRELKAVLDPAGMLRNPFMERLLKR